MDGEASSRGKRVTTEPEESGPGTEGGGRHPMGVVTQRTGLSSHAIRAWERRYGAVEPSRSEGGHRLYSDADIERLRLLHELTRHGHQIGGVAALPDAELRSLLAADRRYEVTVPDRPAPASADRRVEKTLAEAFGAVERMDADALGSLLRRAAFLLPADRFLEEILLPLMMRIGDAWSEGDLRPSQEHVASAVAERVTAWMMDAFQPPPGAPSLVVGTPAGQRHELGALAVALVGASEGWRARYMGPDLPTEELALAARETGAGALALSLVFPAGDPELESQLRRLREQLPPGLPVLVGGAAAASYAAVLEEIEAVRLADFGSLRAVLGRLERPVGSAG